MVDVNPFYQPQFPFTCVAATAVTGGRFVAITGDLSGDEAGAIAGGGGYPTVGHSATARTIGVAARDAEAGERVAVFPPGYHVPVEAGAAVAAGAEVESAADGRAITLNTGIPAGVAIGAAAEAGDLINTQIR